MEREKKYTAYTTSRPPQNLSGLKGVTNQKLNAIFQNLDPKAISHIIKAGASEFGVPVDIIESILKDRPIQVDEFIKLNAALEKMDKKNRNK